MASTTEEVLRRHVGCFFERDPLTADPQTIKDVKVTRTIVGGRTVYQA